MPVLRTRPSYSKLANLLSIMLLGSTVNIPEIEEVVIREVPKVGQEVPHGVIKVFRVKGANLLSGISFKRADHAHCAFVVFVRHKD